MTRPDPYSKGGEPEPQRGRRATGRDGDVSVDAIAWPDGTFTLETTPLDPDPLTYVEPEMEDPRFAMDDWTAPEPSSPRTAVWIVVAGLVGLAIVVGVLGYVASRS